ncbi:MAG: hypothetical protein K6F51_10360 [Acetatifactor sp.]|nr:hypothetical protein [Acetatifactor sp.]
MKTKKIFSGLGFGIILLAFAVALFNVDFWMKTYAWPGGTTSGNNTASGNNTTTSGNNTISGNNTEQEKIPLIRGVDGSGEYVEIDLNYLESVIEKDEELMEYYFESGYVTQWFMSGSRIETPRIDTTRIPITTDMAGKEVYAYITIGKFVLQTTSVTIASGPARIIEEPVDIVACVFDSHAFQVTTENAQSYVWHVEDKNGNEVSLDYINQNDLAFVEPHVFQWGAELQFYYLHPDMDGMRIYCDVSGGGRTVRTRKALLTVEKKIMYLEATPVDYQKAVAGANVVDFRTINMREKDYATASNVKWLSNGSVVSYKEMVAGEKLTIQFEVDLDEGFEFNNEVYCHVWLPEGLLYAQRVPGVAYSSTHAVYQCEYTVQDTKKITDVAISGITVPKEGAKLTAGSVPENANYWIATELWAEYDEDFNVVKSLMPGHVFEEGKIYLYTATIFTDLPYEFANNNGAFGGTISVNGELAMLLDEAYSNAIRDDREKRLEYGTSAYHYSFSPDYRGRITYSRLYVAEPEGNYDKNLKIAKKSLTLYDTIAMEFKIDKASFDALYKDPYVMVTQNGVEKKLTQYRLSDDGKYYVFTVRVAPHQLGDEVKVVPHGTGTVTHGLDMQGVAMRYSVATYCRNMLSKNEYLGEDNESFRRLLVDILRYGDAAQIYMNYKTDDLVSSYLLDDQLYWGTDVNVPMIYHSVKDKNYATVSAESALANIEKASLFLEAAVNIQFKYSADNLRNLRIIVKDYEGVRDAYSADANLTDANGLYYVMFNKLNASEMRKTVYATVMRGNHPVSNTYRYSIESYAASMKGKGIPNLDNLLDAMMRYGDSAADYVNQ